MGHDPSISPRGGGGRSGVVMAVQSEYPQVPPMPDIVTAQEALQSLYLRLEREAEIIVVRTAH
jgi:hypothetical protein